MMGCYIEVPANKGKAAQICDGKAIGANGPYKAELVATPPAFGDIPADKALVAVVDNGFFEAAGLLYDQREYDELTGNVHDRRPRQYVLMDKAAAYMASGYAHRLRRTDPDAFRALFGTPPLADD